MKDRRRGKIVITTELLEQLLHLRDDVKIIAVQQPFERTGPDGEIEVLITGDSVPLCAMGEVPAIVGIRDVCKQLHEDGFEL